jgi:predicted lipid-binding transport protein (Tim44 family)
MTFFSSPVLAETGRPLFDNQWLALFVILGSVTAFILAIASVGRWLAATHPAEPATPAQPPVVVAEPVVKEAPPAPAARPDSSAEIFAAIAAAVAVTLGAKARITAVSPALTEPTADTSRLQWSMEGRRQIYSSHKVR